eukprot:7964732-Pyramimonas_sp.AAC.1
MLSIDFYQRPVNQPPAHPELECSPQQLSSAGILHIRKFWSSTRTHHRTVHCALTLALSRQTCRGVQCALA